MPSIAPKSAFRRFEPSPDTSASARTFVRDTLAEWDSAEFTDDAVLLASELVTNAVVHARTPVEVICRHDGVGVEIIVRDELPHRPVPQVGPVEIDTSPSLDMERNGGLGLALTGMIASSWGVTYGRDDKAVWFRLDRDPEAAPPAGVPGGAQRQGAGRTLRMPDPWSPLEEVLAARLPLDEMLERVVGVAREVLGGDAAYISLATSEESEWEVRTAVGLADDGWTPFRGRTEEIFASAAPELGPVINDDLDAARPQTGRLRAARMRSLVTAALIVDGRTTGLIGVASRRPRHFGSTAAGRLQQGADRIALPVERARLAEVELARRASLSFLAEASDLLTGTLDEEMTAALAAQLAVSRLGSWCAVHTADEAGSPRLAYLTHHDETSVDGLHRLLEKFPPEPRREPGRLWGEAELLGTDLSEALRTEIAHGLAVSLPLTSRGRQLGLMTLGRPPGDAFPRETADVADDLAHRVASALDNAQLYSAQSAMSQALQRSLLPSAVPEIPGVDLELIYRPAGEGTVVGGDFYDVFGTEGHWCVAIGDVCGTGPEAAAVTGLARHTLRALAREGYPPPQILERLNTSILDEGTRARFLTLLYGELSARPEGGWRLRLISAGHPLPLVLRPTGEVFFGAEPQPLLGAFDDISFQTEDLELHPGDVLLAVTDGVTERRTGSKMIGDDGLAEILSDCVGLTAAAVGTRIERALEDFAPGAHNDDTAMLILRFL
ncbi:SpoIIE family protein phosphatase [Allonocardiopsis opalescens]|uniref:Serine phosphatase RsbU (Regulator of sigma subunit) n=1 Tax=Allonocardiopsis opalescens TaxID=1144618 RepID=A0A2T0Q9J6_9ACTN|nr:SpoIIE family protein phosphatase [Allonocardiopsis opalescens]PRY00566.1 serine phosphatase RsbU (regulator of sigma subunit) [Allonocardiopsis opalescens]